MKLVDLKRFFTKNRDKKEFVAYPQTTSEEALKRAGGKLPPKK